MAENKKTPNLFWPVMLIGAGALILLSNLGITKVNLWYVIGLWPLLLVALGLYLLFGRKERWVGNAISIVLVISVVGVVMYAPTLLKPLPGLYVITEPFADPVGDAESARVHLDLDKGGLEVVPMFGHENLIQAEVTHNGRIDFNTSGKSHREVALRLDSISDFWGIDLLNSQRTVVVGLNADLPVDLYVDIGSGNSFLDLEGMDLSELEVDSGSGKIEMVMPVGKVNTYLDVSSGSIDIQTVEGSELDLAAGVGSGQVFLTIEDEVIGDVQLDSGSGRITVFVPRGLALRVIGSTGSGSVNVPNDFNQVDGSETTGTWESPGFDETEEYLLLELDLGSGVARVQYH